MNVKKITLIATSLAFCSTFAFSECELANFALDNGPVFIRDRYDFLTLKKKKGSGNWILPGYGKFSGISNAPGLRKALEKMAKKGNLPDNDFPDWMSEHDIANGSISTDAGSENYKSGRASDSFITISLQEKTKDGCLYEASLGHGKKQMTYRFTAESSTTHLEDTEVDKIKKARVQMWEASLEEEVHPFDEDTDLF